MLLYGERYPCDVGKRTENVSKNRFQKTFPCNNIITPPPKKKEIKEINDNDKIKDMRQLSVIV